MNRSYEDVFNRIKQDRMREFFLNKLGPKGRVIKYKKGSTTGIDLKENLYIVKKGRVTVSLNNDDGDEQYLYYLLPGEILGDFEVLSDVKENYVLKFLEETSFYVLSKGSLNNYLEKNPRAHSFLHHSMARKYHLAIYQVSYNRFYSAEERLLEFLIRLTKSNKGDKLKNIIIEGHTHEEIGNNINTSRIAVTNILKKLKELELIAVSRRSIEIFNIEKLTRYREEIKKGR